MNAYTQNHSNIAHTPMISNNFIPRAWLDWALHINIYKNLPDTKAKLRLMSDTPFDAPSNKPTVKRADNVKLHWQIYNINGSNSSLKKKRVKIIYTHQQVVYDNDISNSNDI